MKIFNNLKKLYNFIRYGYFYRPVLNFELDEKYTFRVRRSLVERKTARIFVKNKKELGEVEYNPNLEKVFLKKRTRLNPVKLIDVMNGAEVPNFSVIIPPEPKKVTLQDLVDAGKVTVIKE